MGYWEMDTVIGISIHALLAESDTGRWAGRLLQVQFLSTLSLRRATRPERKLLVSRLFLSTLSLRRTTATAQRLPPQAKNFYPRSPCGERPDGDPVTTTTDHISIHALLAESDQARAPPYLDTLVFLSTLSLRRATWATPEETAAWLNFYPRSPCGERPRQEARCCLAAIISIHALLAESDIRRFTACSSHSVFLSTLSLRRATDQEVARKQKAKISIHALLAESD